MNENKNKNQNKNGSKGKRTTRGGKSSGSRRGNNNRRNGQNKAKEDQIPTDDKGIVTSDANRIVTGATDSNDVEWYSRITPLLDDVAGLSFSQVAGLPYDVYNKFKTSNFKSPDNGADHTPGMMHMRLMPTIGVTTRPDDAANVAAQQIYTTIRSKVKNTLKYDKTDVMLLIMAMDSAYMLYNALVRAYKTFKTVNYMNRYIPNDLLYVQGFAPDLAAHLADFKTQLDYFAYRLASVCIPNVYDIIKRHSWLFSHVYKDAEGDFAQMYLFIPDGVYVFKEGTDNKPNYLEYTLWETLFGISSGEKIKSVEQIRRAIDTVLAPILGSEDVGTISGNLLDAYGDGNLIKIMAVNEEPLEPVYNAEVLLQMSNATLPDLERNDVQSNQVANNITVNYSDLINGPYLVHQPTTPSTSVLAVTKRRLNYIDMKPTPGLNMVATRLVTQNAISNPNSLYSCGTEIVTECGIWTKAAGGGSTVGSGLGFWQIFGTLVGTADAAQGSWIGTANELCLLSQFDWHPPVFAYSADAATQYTFVGISQDTNTMILLDVDEIKRLNDVAVMSEFVTQGFPGQLANTGSLQSTAP